MKVIMSAPAVVKIAFTAFVLGVVVGFGIIPAALSFGHGGSECTAKSAAPCPGTETSATLLR